MRYYRIDIAGPGGTGTILPSSLNGYPITSLLPSGYANPAALNVELDIPVAAFHTPDGNAFIRIWGLGLQDIGSAFDLNPTPTSGGAIVSVYGGMSAGFPLANPSQARLLVKGQVIQAFGNWIGTAQTVDLILSAPGVGSGVTPVNYSLNWKAGTTMASALSATFSAALPDAKQDIRISGRLTLSYDQPAFYGSLTQLSDLLNGLSKSIITDQNYLGVVVTYDGSTVTAFDGTVTGQAPATQIAFQDLIGQPTWINSQVIQVKCVMRGDVSINDRVVLPPSLVTSTASAFQGLTGNNPANNLTFSGPYLVTNVHHYGNFRQPDAASWATVLEMIKPPSAS